MDKNKTLDQFNVPKYLNRVVYNAVADLQSVQSGNVPLEIVVETVKDQLRGKKYGKLANLDDVIVKSLRNMTKLGVFSSTRFHEYAIRHNMVHITPRNSLANMLPSKRKSKKLQTSTEQQLPMTTKRQSLFDPIPNEGLLCRECHSNCSDVLAQYRSIQFIEPMEPNEAGPADAALMDANESNETTEPSESTEYVNGAAQSVYS